MRWLIALACSVSAATAQFPWERPELTADAKAKLDTNGFVVLDKPLEQGFSAYLLPAYPTFITSDSLLMAYHRLLEEYHARKEIAKMTGLAKCLPALWKRLPEKPLSPATDDREGLRRSRLLVATALRLFSGALPQGLTADETKAVMAEIARVEAGAGEAPQPEWLHSDQSTQEPLDYRVFRPGAFGEGSPALQRHLRCRGWLQEMVVDLKDPANRAMTHHLAVAMLQLNPEQISAWIGETRYVDHHPGLLQNLRGDEGRLLKPAELDEWFEKFAKDYFPEYRTILAREPDLGNTLGDQQVWELLKTGEAGRTPEMLGAAFGNPLARSLVDERLIKRAGDDLSYPVFMKELNQPVDPRAPKLFHSEAWTRKQLNSTLGSWAESRFAIQLARGESAVVLAEARGAAGFVEPVPGLYHALAEAAEWRAKDYTEDVSIQVSATEALALRFAIWSETLKSAAKLPSTDQWRDNPGSVIIASHSDFLERFFPDPLAPVEGHERSWHPLEPQNWLELARQIDGFLMSYRTGDATAAARLQREAFRDELNPRPKLWALATLAYRLEAMSERQLAGQAWTDSDRSFMAHYGVTLGEIMFYSGNSCLAGADDAPRIASYAVDDTGAPRIYHAATARPRLLLIRYPGPDGKEVLCQGSVYAYRDVQRAETPTPALKQWQAESEKAPWPEWMKPVVGSYEAPPGKKDQ